MTSLEALQRWRDSDNQDVDDYNREFPWGPPPLETQVDFLRHRLTKTMGAMSAILQLIIEERADDQSNEVRE